MILQALTEYYQQCLDDPEEVIAPFGYAPQQVGWVLHIDEDGNLVGEPEDQRQPDATGKPRPVTRYLPTFPEKRTSKVWSQFLWDKSQYVLGLDEGGANDKSVKQFQAFRELHEDLLGDSQDPAHRALLRHLAQWDPHRASSLPYAGELAGANIVFRFTEDGSFLHTREASRRIWTEYLTGLQGGQRRLCMATGQVRPIARLHPTVKGVRDAQSSGAALISFNLDKTAFNSYGKTQNFNAPVSPWAAFAYTTALNHLLEYGSGRHSRIGDADVVFWAKKNPTAERLILWTIDPAEQRPLEPDLQVAVEALRQGKELPALQSHEPFYLLGLAGNSARLAVRFWHVGTVGELGDRLSRHFTDLKLQPQFEAQDTLPSIPNLLRETAVLGRMDNIPSGVAAGFVRSVFLDAPYPPAILSLVLNRIRSDASNDPRRGGRVSFRRAALLKAYLSRNHRLFKRGEEVTVALNTTSNDVPYVLGRLFAVLERIQMDANPGIKATITDRYFGAASAMPASVFGQLLRLSKSHIKKADKRPYHEGLLQEVMAKIEAFPRHLSLEDQARFALGYYHQRKWFFTKKEEREEREV